MRASAAAPLGREYLFSHEKNNFQSTPHNLRDSNEESDRIAY